MAKSQYNERLLKDFNDTNAEVGVVKAGNVSYNVVVEDTQSGEFFYINMNNLNIANCYIKPWDANNKYFVFQNVPTTTDGIITIDIMLNYAQSASINLPPDCEWQDNAIPVFVVGKTYQILIRKYAIQAMWVASCVGSWDTRYIGFEDNFNRADAATLGANWIVPEGTIGINSNKAKATSLGATAIEGARAMLAYKDALKSNVHITTKFYGNGMGMNRILFRYVDRHNFITCGWTSSKGVILRKVVNDVGTTIYQDEAVKPGAGFNFSIRAQGNQISIYYLGRHLQTITENDLMTATKHGLAVFGSVADASFEDFRLDWYV